MSLEVSPAVADHPSGIVQRIALDPTASRATGQNPKPATHYESQSSPPPTSQESTQSTASKQTTFTSNDPVDGRQITPTSSASRQDSLSPAISENAHINGRRGTLSSYQSLPAHGTSGSSSAGLPPPQRPSVPYQVDTTAGQKRTADGVVKSSRASSTESPKEAGTRHGRTTSTASRNSQVGELSAQLKARLTYAKMKVEHGWESRTFNEIETLASHPSSPASARTESARGFKSPRNSRYASDRTGLPYANNHAILQPDRPLSAPSRHLQYGQQHDTQDRVQHGHAPYAAHAPPRISLAPPVDLSHPRRSPQGVHGIPGLASTGSHSTLSASSHSSTISPYAPTAPMRPEQEAALKTQTQRTMEQDAIETLLFMRSPGNSATFAHSNQGHPATFAPVANGPTNGINAVPVTQTTSFTPVNGPVRAAPAHNAQQIKLPRMNVDAIPVSPRRQEVEEKVLPYSNLHHSQGIDRALDEIRRRAVVEGQSADSSDEEDAE